MTPLFAVTASFLLRSRSRSLWILRTAGEQYDDERRCGAMCAGMVVVGWKEGDDRGVAEEKDGGIWRHRRGPRVYSPTNRASIASRKSETRS
ncbi:hypothetical protein E2562_038029 [Oryza meyeriana var. granulata]|uniref:Uncharacterized protein n=1 Tax=Oryza meyeriana var. granulata TaxID=110450 RepID=A0A6G1ECU4_9ORYZ|nr:hypothetical protein E2562_038029 [Oryza meyeriana var. granulata]